MTQKWKAWTPSISIRTATDPASVAATTLGVMAMVMVMAAAMVPSGVPATLGNIHSTAPHSIMAPVAGHVTTLVRGGHVKSR